MAAARAKWLAANVERVRAKDAKWRAANKDQALAATARWKAANPERVRVLLNRRRARVHGAAGRYTAEEFAALVEACGGLCLRCGEKRRLTADHVVPLSLGGSNGIENIQPLCRSCNSRKHAKTTDYRKPPALPR